MNYLEAENGFFAPGQPAPYNIFGWIFPGIVAVSMAWAAYVMLARPEAAKTPGSICLQGEDAIYRVLAL